MADFKVVDFDPFKMRLIDADALMEEVYDSDEKHGNDVWHTSDIEYLLMAQPTVDAVPVVHGRWIPHNKGQNNWVECSRCNTVGSPFWKCCPVCEAKMDGDGNA